MSAQRGPERPKSMRGSRVQEVAAYFTIIAGSIALLGYMSGQFTFQGLMSLWQQKTQTPSVAEASQDGTGPLTDRFQSSTPQPDNSSLADMPNPEQTTDTGTIRPCDSLAAGETRAVNAGTLVVGDIEVDGLVYHDWLDQQENTVAVFMRQAVVRAEWGAGCYMSSDAAIEQLVKGQFSSGCNSKCAKVRLVEFLDDGSVSSSCRYPDGRTAEVQMNESGDTWCP